MKRALLFVALTLVFASLGVQQIAKVPSFTVGPKPAAIPAAAPHIQISTARPAAPSDVTPQAGPPRPAVTHAAVPQTVAQAQAMGAYTRLPLAFEENLGQTDGRVKFLSRGAGYNLFLTADGAVLALWDGSAPAACGARMLARGDECARADASAKSGKQPARDQRRHGAALRLKFAGASPSAPITGQEELSAKTNYFAGNDRSKWHTRIPNFAKVRYSNLYPGVDLIFYGNQEQLESDFVVAPGANPKLIQFDVEGARRIRLDNKGGLVLSTTVGDVRLLRPGVYQQVDGARREVAGRYVVLGRNRVGFDLARYDATLPLIIDPTLVYSTFLGGSGFGGDTAFSIAIDSSGNAYVTGQATSVDFPGTDPFSKHDVFFFVQNAFVTKFDPTGNLLIYSTLLSGTSQTFFQNTNSAFGIGVDGALEAVIIGNTNAPDFPTMNPFQATFGNDSQAAFITKLSADGSSLIYSTFYGGRNTGDVTDGNGISVLSDGTAFITGDTTSANFPTVNPMQATLNGFQNGWVAKLNPAGQPIFSTYLGGDGTDQGFAIAVDSSGSAYVTGLTTSPHFPVVPPNTAFQTSLKGFQDAFVSKLKPDGSGLVYSTYLGGTDNQFSFGDAGFGIAVDSSFNAYVTGETDSTDFPQQPNPNPIQPMGYGGGALDAFVTKLSPDGTALVYSTFLGGEHGDFGASIGLDGSNPPNAYLTGGTRSSMFPLSHPMQGALGGPPGPATRNAFVARINSAGLALDYSTYLGGSGSADQGLGIAVDTNGNAYIAGFTNSINFPLAGTFQSTLLSSAGNAFVAKVSPATPAGVTLFPPEFSFGDVGVGQTSFGELVTLTNNTASAITINSITFTGASPGDFAQTNNCPVAPATLAAGASCIITVTLSPTGQDLRTAILTANDTATGSPQTMTVSGNGVVPEVSLSQTSINFGANNPLNVQNFNGVLVTNTSTVPLHISNAQISGLNASDFTVNFFCGASVPPKGACFVGVTFIPSAAGQRTATLMINDDAVGSPQTLPMMGTGVAEVVVFPTSIVFGNQIVGLKLGAGDFFLTNGSGVPITLTSVVEGGANPGDFSFFAAGTTCIGNNQVIQPGGTCAVSPTFVPTAAGNRTANIQFNFTPTNVTPSPITVTMQGTGVTGVVVDQPNLNFGSQFVGFTTFQRIDLLFNGTTQPLNITSLVLSGTNPSDFTISINPACAPANVIPPNMSCDLDLTFTPGALLARSATATINFTGPTGSPVTISLTGTGVAGPVRATPNPVNFGGQIITLTSPPLRVIVSNESKVDIHATSVSITGTNASDFKIAPTSTCAGGLTLKAGSTCVVDLTFTPALMGARTAALTFVDDFVNSPQMIPLNGVGEPSQVSVSINPLDFGNVTMGQLSGAESVFLINGGGSAITVTANASISGTNMADFAIVTVGPNATTCVANAKVLGVGGTCAVVITFKPSMTVLETAMLAIADSEGMHNVTLNGTGVLTPGLSLSSNFVNFNFQPVGTTSSPAQMVTLTNPGNGPLTLSSVALGGTNPGQFAIAAGTTCTSNSPIAAGGNCVFAFTFTPAMVGSPDAFVTIVSNKGNNPNSQDSIFLFGQGITPGVSVSPASIDFGSVAVGASNFNSPSVILTNGTASTITIGTVNLTGTNMGDFSLGFGCSGVMLATGQVCFINGTTFTPTAAGMRIATLNIPYTGAAGSPQTVSLTGTGSTNVVLSPNPLTFASTSVGSPFPPQLTATMSNGTASNVTITNTPAVTGTNAGDFSIAFSSCTLNAVLFASGGTCQLSINFMPTAPGNRTAMITITFTGAPGSPLVLNLQGTATAPVVQLLPTPPSPLTFPSQTVNTQSPPMSVTVTNTGNDNLTITKTTITGANGNDFAFAGGNCIFLPIAPNQSCTIPITFTPSGIGTRNGVLTLTDNASPAMQTVNLVGNGQAGMVTVNPLTLIFNAQNIGTTSPPQAAVLKNATNASITINGAPSISGTNAGDFMIVTTGANASTCTNGAVIASLVGTCVVNITFTPQATGNRVAALTIKDSVGDSFVVSLQGTGANPVVSLTPNPLNFPNQLVGTTSMAQPATLTNGTSSNVTITAAPSVSGTNPGDFTIVTTGAGASTCTNGAMVMANGGFCIVNLTFTPGATGNRTAMLTVTDSEGSHNITLNGVGTAPTVSLSMMSVPFGNQPVSTTSAPMTVTVTNGGTAPLNFTSIAISGTNMGDFSDPSGTTCVVGTQVPPNGGMCVLSLTFTPSAMGARSATLTLTDDAANSPQTISLSGTGTAASVTLAPSPVNFPNQRTGTTSTAVTVTLTNTGNGSLTLAASNAVTFTGTNATDFAVATGTTCTNGAVIPPTNGTCVINVTFTPGANGARTAMLNVADNANPSPQSVILNGTGVFPQASAAPNPLNFNSQRKGTTSTPQTLMLTNNGTDTLHLAAANAVAIAGANAADFAVAMTGTTCTNGATVPSGGGTCVVKLTFTPSTTAAETTTLTITDDANPTTQMVTLNGTGTAPTANVSPGNIAFGNQRTGTTSAGTDVTVSNTGTDTLNISGIALAGTDKTQFTLGAPSSGTACSLTGSTPVAAGSNCKFSVAFAPTTTGSKNANVTVTDDSGAVAGSMQMVTLTGTGVFPQASPMPAALNFNSQTTGTTSAPMTVTLTNGGTDTLHISSVALGGTNPSDFGFSSGSTCGTGTNNPPVAVAGGSSCVVNLTFTPASSTTFNATLAFTDDANGSPQTVTLMGTGVASSVLLNPSTLDFKSQRQGTTSATMTSTLTNNGSATLTNITVTLIGTNPGDFALVTPSSGTDCRTVAMVAVNGTCVIAATFTPTALGSRSATVSIADNANGSPQTVTLMGTGVFPQASAAPNPLPFNNQIISTASAAMTVTLTNGGTDTLHISTVALGGTNPGDFLIATSTTCTNGSTVAPGNATCIVNLTFTPTAAGKRTATLTFTDDANPTAQMVTLMGTGVTPPTATLSTNALSFGNQRVNAASAAMNVTVTNSGGATLNFTSIALGGTNPSDFSDPSGTTCVVGTPVAANGGACTLSVTFTPTNTGNRAATITLTDNADATGAPGAMQTITLSGTGIAPMVMLSSTSLTFVNQRVGTPSASQNVTISNTGTDTLNVSGITLTGMNPGDFAVAGSGASPCSSGAGKIAAGSSCQFSVTFKPTATGPRSASVSIADDAFGTPSPQTVALSGSGIAPAVSLVPASLTFTTLQATGTTSGPQSVMLTNTGTATLNITTVGISGDFALAANTTCTNGSTVAPNANCTINVTFSPTAQGVRNGSVSIADDATPSPQTINLSGTGYVIGGQASFSPSSLTFPGQVVGSTSAAQTITLSNPSTTTTLVIQSIAITGTNLGDFAQTNNCGTLPGTLVLPNKNCVFNVTFTPTATGTRTAALMVTDSDTTSSPQMIQLTGTGATISLTPASGAPLTATVAPGDTAIFPIVLTSNGFTGTVTLTCSSPQQTISCAVIPSTVTVNGTTPIQTAIQVKTFCAWVAPPFAPPANWPGNAPGLLWALALLAMVLLGLAAGSQRRRLRLGMPLAALAVLAILGVGCASLPQSGAGRTPPGSYTLTITATPSAGAPSSIPVTLNVT